MTLSIFAACALCFVSRVKQTNPTVYSRIGATRDGYMQLSENNASSYLNGLNANNEIILTSTTCGYLDMTLNWIEQLRSIGLNNFLVIAEDLPAYEYLLRFAPHNTLPSYIFGRPFSRTAREAASFDSPDFDWCSRPYYLRELIRHNFSALWVDSDAALLRNPFEVLRQMTSYVILVDDEPALQPITRYRHYYCSCFVFVRPSRAAEALLSTWAHLCGNRTQDQIPLNEALDLLKGAVSWQTMPKELYPSGYDAERLTLTKSPGWESPAWIHANWRVGEEAKENFLSRFGLWRNLRAPLHCNAI